MLFAVLVATLALASQSASQEEDGTNFPLILPGRVENTTGQFSPPEAVRVSERNEIV